MSFYLVVCACLWFVVHVCIVLSMFGCMLLYLCFALSLWFVSYLCFCFCLRFQALTVLFVACLGPFHVVLSLCLFGLCVWFVVVLRGPGLFEVSLYCCHSGLRACMSL